MFGEAASRFLWRDFERIVGRAGRDHHMVDRGRGFLEEPLQGGRSLASKAVSVLRVDRARLA